MLWVFGLGVGYELYQFGKEMPMDGLVRCCRVGEEKKGADAVC